MGKPGAPTPTTSKPMKGRNGNKPFENIVKLSAIRRVHGGESKAAVARSISVPESTLRGWCKNEQKIKNQVEQENHQNHHSDASNSSLDSSSSPAADQPSSSSSLLMRASPATVGVTGAGGPMMNFSNGSQPFISTPPKTPGLYTPLQIDIQKDPAKTPQNLPLRAELPRSNGRNKAELHRIGMGMYGDPMLFNSHQSPRAMNLQEMLAAAAATTTFAGNSKKSSQHAPAGATTGGPSDNMVAYAAMTQLILQNLTQQQQQQQQSMQLPKIQQMGGGGEGMFSTCGLQSTSSRPSSRGNKRMSAPSTSSSSPLNGALTPEMLQLLSPPFPGCQTPAKEQQDVLQQVLAYQIAAAQAQAQAQAQAPAPAPDRAHHNPVNNGRSRLPPASGVPIQPFSDKYWARLMRMSSRPQTTGQRIPERNVAQLSPQNMSQGTPQIDPLTRQDHPQDYPQDLRKSVSPRESHSPASSVSSNHHGSDYSSPGTPSNNRVESNRSSPLRASPAPGDRYSHESNRSAATEATTSPAAATTSQPQPSTIVAAPEKSPPCLSGGRLEAVLAGIFKRNKIEIPGYNDNHKDSADCDEFFKTHLGAPIHEIEHREDGLLVGKMFYNFLNKFGSNPAITATFLGQMKHAIHAISVRDQIDTPMDQSE